MPRPANQLTTADIDAFARRLKATVALAHQALAIKAALGRFSDGAPAAPQKTAARAGAPKTAGRRTRRPGLAPEKVAQVLSKSQGLSLAEVAKKVGEANKARVSAALQKLRDDKKAKVVGERRGAKWLAA